MYFSTREIADGWRFDACCKPAVSRQTKSHEQRQQSIYPVASVYPPEALAGPSDILNTRLELLHLWVRSLQWSCWSRLLQKVKEIVKRHSTVCAGLHFCCRVHDSHHVICTQPGNTGAGAWRMARCRSSNEKGLSVQASTSAWRNLPERFLDGDWQRKKDLPVMVKRWWGEGNHAPTQSCIW